MEEEKDNPFRPDDEIYHEVEPIVEVYKTHPFPRGMENPDGPHPASQNSPNSPKNGDKKDGKNSSKWIFGGKKKENGSAVEETLIKT